MDATFQEDAFGYTSFQKMGQKKGQSRGDQMGGYKTVMGCGIKNLDSNNTVEMGRKEFMWKILRRINKFYWTVR